MMKSWRIWVGFLISAGFLYFAFRGQDFGKIRDSLSHVNYWYLIPAIALYFLGVYVRAFRWSVLLRPVKVLRAREVFPVTTVGFMANNILPLRTGEIVRAYVINKRFNVSKTASLATIAVERLFDGLTMLAFMLVAAIFVSFTSDLRHLAIVAFIVFACLIIGLTVLTFGGSFRDRLMQIVLGPMPTPVADKVERMAESFLSGLGVLTRKGDLGLVAVSSALAWLLEASMYWMIARGFGSPLSDVMGVAASLLTTGVANLATLIPSSPGYVGPFEAGVVLVVNGALGVDKSLALSYAVVVHAALYFPITVWGLIEWSRMHISLRMMRDFESESDQNGVETAPASTTVPSLATSAAGSIPSHAREEQASQ
jgi:glycosyltransferase 2 family protein